MKNLLIFKFITCSYIQVPASYCSENIKRGFSPPPCFHPFVLITKHICLFIPVDSMREYFLQFNMYFAASGNTHHKAHLVVPAELSIVTADLFKL